MRVVREHDVSLNVCHQMRLVYWTQVCSVCQFHVTSCEAHTCTSSANIPVARMGGPSKPSRSVFLGRFIFTYVLLGTTGAEFPTLGSQCVCCPSIWLA